MKKKILMIAYHFPPLHGSSGIQRTLRFVKYLPEFDWQPIVLTAHPRAYIQTNDDQAQDITNQAIVHRAFALDTSRHLSVFKRYPRFLALPDCWASWVIGAIPLGLYLIQKYKPDFIWSTYPIATAHLIGLSLNKLTGVPWIADFRDPMTEENHPQDPQVYRSFKWIEEKAITHSTKSICTTPSLIKHYKLQYPDIPDSRFELVENGYDEELFKNIENNVICSESVDKQFILLHSGIIYSSERNPIQLFEALAKLLQQKIIMPDNFKLVLRATQNDSYIKVLVGKFGISSIISIKPPVSYHEALSEMLIADGLLIIQAANCNMQIPAKLYEYIRARRPILALTDSKGDTANKLTSLGIKDIAQLDSQTDIYAKLVRFLAAARNNTMSMPLMDKILTNSRRSKTIEFVNILNTLEK